MSDNPRFQDWDRTSFEKVDTCTVPTNVKVLLEHTALLDSKLSEIIPTIVPDEDHSSRFEHLLCSANQITISGPASRTGSELTLYTLAIASCHSSG